MLLKFSEVSLAFGGVRCLDKVSFEVAPGELVGLIGPNGAGKTTVMNILSGLHRPDSGQVYFAGQRIDGLPSHRIARMGMGRTFQTALLAPGLNLVENVVCGMGEEARYSLFDALLHTRRMRAAESSLSEEAKDTAIRVGLPTELNERGGQHLSFGQQRLTEFSRAVLSKPKLLLLDEPAVGLAPPRVKELGKLIRSATQNGTAVLLIEHLIDLVLDVCDRVVVMNAGQVIANGAPDKVTSDSKVIESYLGRQYYAQR